MQPSGHTERVQSVKSSHQTVTATGWRANNRNNKTTEAEDNDKRKQV